MRKLFLILLLIVPVMLGGQEVTKVGTAGAKFLSISVIPRASGMGEAFVSVSNDASSPFWNPAGIANLEGKGMYIGYTNWLAGTKYSAVSFVKDMGLLGKVAVFMSGLYIPGFEATQVSSSGIEEYDQSFSYSALQTGLSYAKYFTDKFAAGVNLKFLYEDYGHLSFLDNSPHPVCYGVALDAGTFFKTGWKSLRISMSLQNLGPDMKPSGSYVHDIMQGSQMTAETLSFRSYPLPMIFRLGAAMEVIDKPNEKLTLAVEATHPNDNKETFAIGSEFSLKNIIFLRAGYKLGVDEGGLSAGAGFIVKNIRVDYSFTDFGALPDIHRLGISYQF